MLRNLSHRAIVGLWRTRVTHRTTEPQPTDTAPLHLKLLVLPPRGWEIVTYCRSGTKGLLLIAEDSNGLIYRAIYNGVGR